MKKNLFRISMAVGASVVIATALFVYAAVTNPPSADKKQAATTTGSAAASDVKASESTLPATAAASQAEQTFTLKQLAAYNGQNGQPAYVAYKGSIYDLTAVGTWNSGKHHGISAGTDVTEAFASSPHAASILKMGIVMGKLVSETAAVDVQASSPSVADTNSSATVAVVAATVPAASTAKAISGTSPATPTEPVFTLKQLAVYNGQNGHPAYVAYKGIVYDLTAVSNWSSGKHHGISAGTDVTVLFSSSPHAVSILKLGFAVGKVGSNTVSATSASSVAPSPSPAATSAASGSSPSITTAIPGPALKVYTSAQLAKYNALGGNPAYVAYKGIVYDLSAVGTWSSGKHHGVTAGTDITALLASSPHAVSILSLGFVVGTMEGFTGTVPARAAPAQSGGTYVSGSDDDDDQESDDEEYDDDDQESDDEGYDD